MPIFRYIISTAAANSIALQGSFQTEFGLTTSQKGLLTAVQNVGCIVASLFAGSIIDRLGRKGGILISSSTVLVACIVLTTSTTKAQFFVGRVIVGFGRAFDIAAVPAYLVEMSPPKRRGFVAGLYWACWLLGAIISSAIGYGARSIGGSWSWRTICICMCGPALTCLAMLPFIPESPRWLMAKNREDEALKVLTRYHGRGDQNDPLVVAQFREIKETIAYEQSNKYETWGAWWRDFSGNMGNRRRGYTLVCLAVFEQTVGSSIISFYLSSVLTLAGVTSEKEQFAINLGQNCVAFVSALVGICLLDKVGRVKMLVAGSAFCAVILAIMAGLTADQIGNSAGRNGIIAMVFLFQMGYSSTWTPISFTYCAEILNFTIRARGMA
jgi:sugar porter (SP) family MFS transporter